MIGPYSFSFLLVASTKAFNLPCFVFLGLCVQVGSKIHSSSKHGLLSVDIVYDGQHVNKYVFVNILCQYLFCVNNSSVSIN